MKRAFILLLVALAGITLLSGCVNSPQGEPAPVVTPLPPEEKPHYNIGIDADYPPFTYRDSTGNFSGFDIDSARWIAEREGFTVEFVQIPWDTIIPTLQDGRIDMIYSGMAITPERQKEVNFTIPYYTVNTSMAVRSGSNITLQDLYDGRIRVGTQSGSADVTWVESTLIRTGKMPAAYLVLYPDLVTLTGGLLEGQIDASLADTPSQERLIAGKDLVIVGEIPTDDRYAVAVRKTDPKLLSTMNDGLRRLMADPHWQVLLNNYGLSP
ncbi:polar amino acid transport system substrate-binding protein [Methanolinea mesophila]|uniref:ABC transporter substrate-binding protein n=1 Tax=Methanolinea mesophila TaxID=547055 RepID=UPI001AE9EA0A|nr:ABC transporter substrate-binding protein [Methanolinea mesophila]MBP1929827.1 polar amino acid transport system substrate-binding protein [Methanolinea mesophila]